MTLMYRMLTPNYKTRVAESRTIWGITPRKPKITAINDSPRIMLDDNSDRHFNKRIVLPDFTFDNDDGPMGVYCLKVVTEGERTSTYAQIMKSKDSDKWLKAVKEEMNSIKSQGAWVLTELLIW